MPEGHTLHRLAGGIRERFAGRAVRVSSPQGRFADAAALLDGSHLLDAQAWGKQLFVEFEGGRSLAAQARAGLVTEQTPGALQSAAVAFGWPVAPMCNYVW